jgi:hypothetical protein
MPTPRNLRRIDLYCPEYKTDATIRIVENHRPSGRPHIVVEYAKGGYEGSEDFAASIPPHWSDSDLVELILLRNWPRVYDRDWPAWEIPARDYGSSTLYKFWKGEKQPEL